MYSRLIERMVCASFLYLLLIPAQGQTTTVVIMDQGHNSLLPYRGSSQFVTQHCFSFADRFVGFVPPLVAADSSNYTTMNASLCGNGQPFQFFNSAASRHPRTFFDTVVNRNFTTSNDLDHSQIMSNALWDFDRNIQQQHFQVFGLFGNRRANPQKNFEVYSDTLSYTSNGGINIANALDFLVRNPILDIGAVSIATVIGRTTGGTPNACLNNLGQVAVDRLRDRGVAVVAGLRNNDVASSAKSWPNCLDGVINVGRTDGFSPPFTGIGIGSNTIDFYIKSATQHENRLGQNFTSTGNSFASPKIAGAFAALHKRSNLSTVDQKYRALQQASARTYSHNGFTRRRLAKDQIDNAIALLQQIIESDNQPDPPSLPPTSDEPDNLLFDPTPREGVAKARA